ncbi:MAG: hypothetical protein AUH81_08495 [Candidatus Rokubacteria bacterium 13_1_40CM_4_69_5]|nr:MAG: hypothetical protein AUH81_08495 [Candidatus Rokubacteria bacterium 13_1_40CM_4_69_5]
MSRERLWLGAAAVVLIGVDLGNRVLASNDEARFPLLAQDILTRGAWLFPQLNGAPYLHKPVLVAWLIALVSLPAGHVTQFTAALPLALAALVTAFVIHALGRELFGGSAGLLAGLVALTTQGFVTFSRTPVPDMVMGACISGSLWMLVRMTRGAPRAWIGFYGLAGLAFWTKGTAGLMPLVIALAWTLVSARPDKWRALRLPRGALVLAAIVAPWWIGGLLVDAPAMRGVVVSDQLFWYLPRMPTPSALALPVAHALGIVLPWTVIGPAALVGAVRAARSSDPAREGVTFALVWAGLTLALVAISHEQRFRYYLPLVPPVALLLGWWLARAIAARRSAGRVFGVGWALSALALLTAYHVEMRQQNADYDYPRLSATLQEALGDPEPVATWEIHHLPLAFYLGRPVRPIGDEADLQRAAAAPPHGVVIVRDATLAKMREREGLIVLRRERFAGRDISIVSRRM